MKIYNTLSRQIEEFRAVDPSEVTLYTCGPTVYNFAHIGNLRAFLFYDLLKRTLIHNGYKVKHVMNITDVGHLTDDADSGEDKMEKGAKRESKTAWDVAKYYTDAFLSDIKSLNILPPTFQPKATEYIEEQIELIKKLEVKGFTYVTTVGVVYDTSKFPNYSKFSKIKMDELREGARVEVDTEKRNITDFYLWKFSPTDHKRDMEWESPWGKGFPGWHIECSAMALNLLGETIDIHTGGIDHIPVHHTNEIAQSEGATGKQFSNYWMHNNFLNIAGGIKMAKSGDNFYTLQKIVDLGFEPMVFRYMMLTAHYRSELEFSIESLNSAKHTLQKIRSFLHDANDFKSESKLGETKYYAEFYDAINDDLNSANALSVLHTMLGSDISLQIKRESLIAFDDVLGLELKNELTKSEWINPSSVAIDSLTVKDLFDLRLEARSIKDWGKSDQIRKQIESLGYIVEDTSSGQKLKKM